MSATHRNSSTASRHGSEDVNKTYEDVEADYSKYLPTYDSIQSKYEEVGKALKKVQDTIRIRLDTSHCEPLFSKELHNKITGWIEEVNKREDSQEISGQVKKICDEFAETLQELAKLKRDATDAKRAKDKGALQKVIKKMKGYEDEYYRVYAKGAHRHAPALPLK
ncbi:uncharacterized protein FOMMEDRAFT_157528 [Fomitiporia mediterranea MF3/22]|uniref:uncharacterized protein n=1 Tax=Fomitiporia mediterranea (strain MF3/22) TaxID=694068 RepID=UPI000440886F|nr:uncharacterized protein FOMMEDRAFT_157528 [Fomitiporia mediterranea MF3/22]EJD02309.1 hypothetical protein FOMMEDRAFT_157528 [Fomitiporia mediterranea MF3/22]